MASTRAIRGERFSQSLDLRRNPIDPPETERSLPPSPPPKGAYHPPPPPFPLPPLPALTRSKTQPAKLRPEPTKPVSAKSPSPRTHIRNQSERRSPRSGGPSLTLLRPGLASDSHLPISQGKEKEMGLETVASIANRIAARELQEHMHDSWDFLDYYAQSSGRGEKL
ncbi:hypothetical protein BDP27DRAFT_1343231 [Rhodocollybia butyracea]|uniref:Uncharacterized protein n=1 Tax=Rhodocollybia butyracea TaxID=206335 RepID=A0A9P5PAM3_9AGAR|nr:hypothetical protein BDP27DRAFT_1343231 [Rhodocollybia butyracea]